jgi:hypothetical protein
MADKKKPHTAGTGTASKTTFDSRNHTATDQLIGWFNLAKPSRNRQQKRTWKRGCQHGRIDSALAAQLALLAVAFLLFVGGVAA